MSVENYSQFNGFGAEQYDPVSGSTTGAVTMQDLQKAMGSVGAGSGAGYDAPDPGAGSIQPTITESLESTLKRLTLSMKELKLYRTVRTEPAYALAEEFLQLVDIGSETGGFHEEFDLPEMEETQYRRKTETVKYLGETRAVSHQAQLVRSRIGDVVQTEVDNGTTRILRTLNRSLAFGNARIVPQEFNGIYEQHGSYGGNEDIWSTIDQYHNSELVYDVRGNHLTQQDVLDASEVIDNNHGVPDTLWGPNKVMRDFAKDYINTQRTILNSEFAQNGQHIGSMWVSKFPTPFGEIDLIRDKYLQEQVRSKQRRNYRSTSESATDTKAPAAPVSPTFSVVSGDGKSHFGSGDTGDYYYAVAAVNRFGESALTPIDGDNKITVSAAQDAVDLGFSNGSGNYATTGFIVYRSKIDPAVSKINDATLYPIFKLSTNELSGGYDQASGGMARDRNRWLPDTEQAFMWETSEQVFGFKQLAPLMKMDLARLDPTIRFMVLMYGTPQLYNHLRVVRFVNIGDYS